MKRCKYWNKLLHDELVQHQVGYFYSPEHFEKYKASLSRDAYIE